MKKMIIILIAVGLVIVGGVIATVAIIKAPRPELTSRTETFENTIKNFEIETDTADLTFTKTAEDKIIVLIDEDEKEHYDVSVDGDVLIIKAITQKWYQNFLLFNYNKRKITISLPSEAYESLIYKGSTGDVNIPSDVSFTSADLHLSTGDVSFSASVVENLRIEVSTGKIKLNSLNAKNIELLGDTGNISLDNVKAYEALSIKVDTGKVSLTDVLTGTLYVKSSTGDQILTKTIASGDATLIASTGDIKFDRADAANFDIKTSTGNIKGSICTPKLFNATSNTGKVTVPQDEGTSKFIAKSSTGNINITIYE